MSSIFEEEIRKPGTFQLGHHIVVTPEGNSDPDFPGYETKVINGKCHLMSIEPTHYINWIVNYPTPLDEGIEYISGDVQGMGPKFDTLEEMREYLKKMSD